MVNESTQAPEPGMIMQEGLVECLTGVYEQVSGFDENIDYLAMEYGHTLRHV